MTVFNLFTIVFPCHDRSNLCERIILYLIFIKKGIISIIYYLIISNGPWVRSNTSCPKEISCPCTTFWIFLVYPSTCKNHNSLQKSDWYDSWFAGFLRESIFISPSLRIFKFILLELWIFELSRVKPYVILCLATL